MIEHIKTVYTIYQYRNTIYTLCSIYHLISCGIRVRRYIKSFRKVEEKGIELVKPQDLSDWELI